MSSGSDFEAMIESMKEETELIEGNRSQRNRKYHECMGEFKDLLRREAEMLEGSERANSEQKELISKAFENSFERILSSSDVSIRRIKQTYQEKKQFWDNVIKQSAGVGDLDLKKEFYLQRRNAEESCFEATDHQKDKHKPYHVLMNKADRKEPLRDFQLANKHFEEKVVQATNTLQQWQNISAQGRQGNSHHPFQHRPSQHSLEGTVINKFVALPPKSTNYDPVRKPAFEPDSSTSFLNNFTKKY